MTSRLLFTNQAGGIAWRAIQLVIVMLCGYCAWVAVAMSTSESAVINPHAPVSASTRKSTRGSHPAAYIRHAGSDAMPVHFSMGDMRVRRLWMMDDYAGDNYGYNEYRGTGRRYHTRGDRRRLGRFEQTFRQLRPESRPWVTEDFGGIPKLPLRTPIEMGRDPVIDEFLEMRKRQVPHSLLKDYYMQRLDGSDEEEGNGDHPRRIFRRNYEDYYLYLLGEGIMPQLQSDDEGERHSETRHDAEGGSAEEYTGEITPDEPREYERQRDRLTRNEEYIKMARERQGSYSHKDKIFQFLLAAMKDYERANVNSEPPEDIPENLEIMDPQLEDYFLTDCYGSPIYIAQWNEEYLKGREGLEGKALIDYDNMWYERIDRLNSHFDHLHTDDTPGDVLKSYFVDADAGDIPIRRSKSGHRKPPRVVIAGKALKMKWSEHLSPSILELLAKNSLRRHRDKDEQARKRRMLDFKADIFNACVNASMNRLVHERGLRQDEEDRLKYIQHLHDRRKVHNDRFGCQPNTPYWIWEEFWKDRSSILQDTMVEILRSVRCVEPDADVAELTKGTVEHIKSPKLQGTRFEVPMMLDPDSSPKVDRLEAYIKRFGRRSDASTSSPPEASTAPSEGSPRSIGTPSKIDDGSTSGQKRSEIDGLPVPKPLGYYFRDVLSFDKFEEEYEKFNMECFGTKDYGVSVGQLVKGTVEDVKPKRLLVDIHTSKLAVMRLVDHFNSPQEVPSGGFTSVFKKGDVMYFEVISKYGNDINVSTLHVQEMYKHREIYRKHFKREIFKVRAIQRYSSGLLVQYQGDDVEDIEDYQMPDEPRRLENLAFIPYRELDRTHRSEVQRIKLGIVGKVLPVYIADWAVCDGVPLVSNIEALRRLPLGQIQPGDIIRAKRCMYGKDAVWVHFGHTIGTLSVMDMSKEDYAKHVRGDTESIVAAVRDVHLLAGSMELYTKGAKTSGVGIAVNEWKERMRLDPDPIKSFNDAVAARMPDILKSSVPGRVNPKNVKLNPIHSVPNRRITLSSTPSLPPGKSEAGISRFEPIRWDFSPTASKHKDEDELQHAYNTFTWQVLTEHGWADLTPAEQRVFNRARFQNDEVVYYQHDGRSYRADLLDMVRQNLTDLVEQPLRNDCYVALNEKEMRAVHGINLPNSDPGVM
ncbi:hypothetical protein, conserved [Babesia bigemina]|uniref:S1 motif domain-containing protein n=1 Tax=Babesia bigemina TaxID=5866 RepID=A0A061DA51_BABBI|nr:hypothetical protein, conserved [Babesia bigemina]CDR96822.1 hypothetical protein, conserved [Babesia bigemina]|eukprot:XP_012769008.1 hypothetical protein, conserved [Babesia bigemina]